MTEHSIYVELADQYKTIDAASNVAKRNVLAQHVHEILDVLEQKVGQVYTSQSGASSNSSNREIK